MDLLLAVMLIICWGLTFPTPYTGVNAHEATIQKDFPFIINSPLAALALVGILNGWSSTSQMSTPYLSSSKLCRHLHHMVLTPFLLLSTLISTPQASLLSPTPMTHSYIIETSPEDQWQGESVLRASRYTTGAFGIAFALSAGLYAVRGSGIRAAPGEGIGDKGCTR